MLGSERHDTILGMKSGMPAPSAALHQERRFRFDLVDSIEHLIDLRRSLGAPSVSIFA
jgi:hypothetical protein